MEFKHYIMTFETPTELLAAVTNNPPQVPPGTLCYVESTGTMNYIANDSGTSGAIVELDTA